MTQPSFVQRPNPANDVIIDEVFSVKGGRLTNVVPVANGTEKVAKLDCVTVDVKVHDGEGKNATIMTLCIPTVMAKDLGNRITQAEAFLRANGM